MRGFVIGQLDRVDVEGQVFKSLFVGEVSLGRFVQLIVELLLLLAAEFFLRL